MFYRIYDRFCSSEVSGIILEDHVFLRNTRLYRRAHPYVIDGPVDRIIPCEQNSFLSTRM